MMASASRPNVQEIWMSAALAGAVGDDLPSPASGATLARP
ncbi:hypothetical protein X805_41600 [Sphaerotilus natans subsp. natans DSM 6575]|uniref:Uncharacterized protein n=1 Tax=Sphaerotilus natans subsp. natans DSM 6575 TaxID=1286631 RepID=A0A059KG93_9BURK|nr:hypothetical protein X805_41600 [Sphaerotilus natans subsp. natans DSM 6575]